MENGKSNGDMKVRDGKDGSSYDDFDKFTEGIQALVLEEARKIYSERTIREAYDPKNVGQLEDADGVGRMTGSCGDTMQIALKVDDNRIVDSKFLTDGCGASIACGSLITELIKGKSIVEALSLEAKDILSVLGGLPKESLHCSVLAVDTLKAAINDYKSRMTGGKKELATQKQRQGTRKQRQGTIR